jgi:hypothetical protein
MALCSLPGRHARPAAWRGRKAKQTVLDFIATTTHGGSPTSSPLPSASRCSTTTASLWSEQPVHVQFAFALDRIKDRAAAPEWRPSPIRQCSRGTSARSRGAKAIVEMMMATHAGMSGESSRRLPAMSRQPGTRTGRLYREMTYEPMVQLLRYLRTRGYRTYIVPWG